MIEQGAKILKAKLAQTLRNEEFCPSWLLGIWINPFFIIRKGLFNGVRQTSKEITGGKLLDIGCGSKPYENLFDVEEYIGIDLRISGHDHKSSKVDKYYDGKVIPFDDEFFDNAFSSEVFEHIFNIDEVLSEIHRVMKNNGKLCITCPFVWDEHEQPYDFARYTSYGIRHLLNKNGFELIQFNKSTSYLAKIFQMLSAYVFQHLLPKNKYGRFILTPIFVAPINIIGSILNFTLPSADTFYHNNIVLAKKVSYRETP